MCVPILKSIGSELTSCDAKPLRRASWGLDTSDRECDKEHFETNQKSLRLPVQKLWLK